MKVLMIIVLVIYFIASLFLFLYSLTQGHLLWKYFTKQTKTQKPNFQEEILFPKVTIQLPIYNEQYVTERLINKICEIDYPKTLLEIQVLDDSTDETISIAKKSVDAWKSKGIDIVYIHRTNRKGFKAGALEEGLTIAKGEYIAIFDADFLPEKDFLKKTIPYFQNEKVGMVQTRWAHLNKKYNVLTRLQAFALDAHFTVEQVGRNENKGFINFNGTAGVWRKSCIIDSGNWSADTLTEDLDLSYRAQLKNWEFVYLEDVASPAELPPVMSALKNQQYRWTKGGAETAKKHLLNVIRSKKPLVVKWHALMHLLNSAVFVSILVCALLSVPLLFVKTQLPEFKNLFILASIFVLSFLILAIFYLTALLKLSEQKTKSFFSFFALFPSFLSVSMGLSLHNAVAVLEGYAGKKTSFIRTPKFNLSDKKGAWQKKNYIAQKIPLLSYIELFLVFYFAFGIIYAFQIKDYGLLPFHIMMMVGYFVVSSYTFLQFSKSKVK
jgi:cellulose synthase/poly-beta-1,6-N-acetylglucosamine synthase-like glycosyltransferase